MPLHRIDSPDDPRLDPYRNLKQTNLTRWSGRFIAEGEKVVHRLLQSSYRVESVLLAESHQDLIDGPLLAKTDVLVVSQSLAEQLVGYNFHAGVLACGLRQPAHQRMTLSDLWPAATFVVACDRVTDPDNLGTIIRLCTAFGVEGLILGPGCADPFSRRTLRVSMGNAFSLPIHESTDLFQELSLLRQVGFRLFSTILHPSATQLDQCRRPEKLLLLLGNEAHGLEERWLEGSDSVVMIPMSGETDSLNVGVAAGIILHYFARTAVR